eukprot:3543301-Pleurochrysis_carterae.AAC.1
MVPRMVSINALSTAAIASGAMMKRSCSVTDSGRAGGTRVPDDACAVALLVAEGVEVECLAGRAVWLAGARRATRGDGKSNV